jgi:uncharacterized membrane protein
MESLIRETDKSFIMRNMDRTAPLLNNFIWTIVPALGALVFGGLINNVIAKAEDVNPNSPLLKSRGTCIGYFALQLLVNVVILIAAMRAYKPFVPWLQLTVSGIASAVLFFAVQQGLTDNALCAVQF